MTLSIVIPSYNASKTLGDCVASAVAAGVNANDVIVVDDGSTDETRSLALSLPCRYIHQENAGVSNARRRGFTESSGDLIIFLDADDLLNPAAVAQVSDQMENSPEPVGIIVASLAYRSETGTLRPRPHPMPEIDTEKLVRAGFSPCPPGGIMYRRQTLNQLLAADALPQLPWVNPRFSEDYEWLLRASMLCNIQTSDAPLISYNPVGGKSLRLDEQDGAEFVRAYYAGQLNIAYSPKTRRQLVAEYLNRRSLSEWGSGNRIRSLGLRAQAAAYCPSHTLATIRRRLVTRHPRRPSISQ